MCVCAHVHAGAGKMAQWITGICLQTWWPEFYYPQEPHDRRREPTPLIYLVLWHLHAHHGTQCTCMHAHTQSITQSMFIINQTLRQLARWVRFQIHTAREGNRKERLSFRRDCFFCNQQSLFMKPLQFCFYRQVNLFFFSGWWHACRLYSVTFALVRAD